MQWRGPAEAGRRKTFFSLLAMKPTDPKHKLACLRAGPARAALMLPAESDG